MIEMIEICFIYLFFQLLSERHEHLRMTMSPGSMASLTGAGAAASNMVALPARGHSQASSSQFTLTESDRETETEKFLIFEKKTMK